MREREREKKKNYQEVAWHWYIYKPNRRWKSKRFKEIAFANVSLHLIFVQDRKTIFLPTELLTVVRQKIWHHIKT